MGTSSFRKTLIFGVGMASALLASATAAAAGQPRAGSAQVTQAVEQVKSRLNQLNQEIDVLKAQLEATQKQLEATQKQAQAASDKAASAQAQAKVASARAATQQTANKPEVATNYVEVAPGIHAELHGFVSASYFYQDQNFFFGNGQNGEFPNPPASPGQNNGLSGGDVRNSRAWLEIAGPTMGNGWHGGAHLEFDFFGGNNGTGAFSGQQPVLRLRQAYVTVDNDQIDGKLVVGQQWTLIFPYSSIEKGVNNLPESLTHIAFPLGYGTGMIGWRFPGIVYSQGLGKLASALADFRFDAGVFEGSYDGPGSNINFASAGNVNFHPQIQSRLSFHKDAWFAYLASDYSSEQLSGVGGTEKPPLGISKITTYAVVTGASWTRGPYVVGINGYVGRALGANFGALTQFGDIREFGGYLRAGYKFNQWGVPFLDHWGLYGNFAYNRPNQNDVIRWLKNGSSGRLRNKQVSADLIYTNGPFGFGFEWLHSILHRTATGADFETVVGNQASFSAIYHF
ncbi:MAG: hypothetical protein KGJ55_01790 [Gammaproteobacteria bacterium]|nr:hypothetical protein [Gammaproteobacteria bacterium]